MANDDGKKPAGKKADEREKHLKLRQVEVFARAAHLGNLGLAAKELSVSPAYISEAIASLERDLGEGVVLFDRNPGGSRLTRAGEMFAEQARRLLSAEVAARNAIDRVRHDGPEPLTVAYEPSFAGLIVPALLALQRKLKAPVHGIEADSESIVQQLREERAEIGIVYPSQLRGGMPDDLPSAGLAGAAEESRLWLVTGSRNAPRNSKAVSLESLTDEPFALPWLDNATAPGWQEIRRQIELHFARHRFAPKNVVFRSTSVTSVLMAVRAGLGMTICPSLALTDMEGLSIRPLATASQDPMPEHEDIWITLYRTETPSRRQLTVFLIEHINALAKDLNDASKKKALF